MVFKLTESHGSHDLRFADQQGCWSLREAFSCAIRAYRREERQFVGDQEDLLGLETR